MNLAKVARSLWQRSVSRSTTSHRYSPASPPSSSWTCPTCRAQNYSRWPPPHFSRSSSSAATTEASAVEPSTVDSWLSSATAKPYFVTTPIFYVNSSPHIGHLHTMIVADVLKRWQTLRGTPALLSTGTDEHGVKVQRAAAQKGVSPLEFCDANSAQFIDLAHKANIAHDFFVRTTDDDHVAAVQEFWSRLNDRGYIYQKPHKGWYAINDECFCPESAIERVILPTTGKVISVWAETGSPVEWVEEMNYHFRITALKDQLLEFYHDNPDWVSPRKRMNEVVSWVENNLQDLSISRRADRLSWGIRVPGDESQVIYVWMDALVNYLHKAGFPHWPPGHECIGGWPADLHVIGKEILRFHAIYWPAFLLALGYPLPKRLLCHAHWTLSGKKMSKTTGNVVNPFFALDRWGVDALRYYFVRHGCFAHDTDYTNELVAAAYKSALQKGLGNLCSRLTRPKCWSVAEAVCMSERGELGESPGSLTDHHRRLVNLPDKVSFYMDHLRPSKALDDIFDTVVSANQCLTCTQPWDLAHRQPRTPADIASVNEVVYVTAETLRIMGILLQPFMPSKSAELLDRLGVQHDRRSFDFARLGRDYEYGRPFSPPGQSSWQGLFPPLPVED